MKGAVAEGGAAPDSNPEEIDLDMDMEAGGQDEDDVQDVVTRPVPAGVFGGAAALQVNPSFIAPPVT